MATPAAGAATTAAGSSNTRSAGVRARPKDSGSGEESYFECNICLDGVREPVVTRCGHLFCWPCLYRWLNTNQTECPVCKAGVTATNVIPLYGRGADSVDPRMRSSGVDGVPNRPEAERPEAQRPRPPNPFAGAGGLGGGWGGFGGGMEGNGMGGVAGGQVHFQAGLGFFPSLFGLQFQSFTFPAGHGNAARAQGNAAAQAEGANGATPADGRPTSGGEASAGAAGANGNAGNSGGSVLTAEEAQQAFLSRLLLMLGSFVVLCLVLF